MRFSRSFVGIAALALAGALLGLLIGRHLADTAARRMGVAQLTSYAQRLQRVATQIDTQTLDAVAAVANDRLPFCSPRELAFMRGIVYNSSQIKDIGRLKDNVFYCSSETGVMPTPTAVPLPDASFRNTKIYVWIPIMFGENARGFVIQVRNVNVVLNPHAFDSVRDPTRSYAAYLFDSPTRHLVQGFGDRVPLDAAEIIRSQPVQKGGMEYVPTCSNASHVCVVAGESVMGLTARNRSVRPAFLLAGACLGNTVVLLIALFYRKHRSQEQQLRRAVRRGTLRVVYQPIVDMHSSRVVGAEALLRWTNEDEENVNPEIFAALAEQKGFVTSLTRLVLRRVTAEMADVLRAPDFRLTVNITAQDLEDPSFLPFVRAALADASIDASAIGLELTERSTARQEALVEKIADLRKAGHSVYIDDFGTGYSSLAYLRDLHVDAIKIDRSFTASLGTSAITEAIVPQILRIADQLHFSVIVEGVETLEQVNYFRNADRQIWAQGWYYSPALSAFDLKRILSEDGFLPRATADAEADAAKAAVSPW